MTTARNLIKNRIRAGNTVIGVGCYSAALSSQSYDKVLKIGNSTTDPWLEYYYDVIAPNNGKNPHYPKVHSIHVDEGNDYYVAVVERLYEHEQREFGDIVGNDDLENVIIKAIDDDSLGLYEFMEELTEGASSLSYGEFDEYKLYEAVEEIRRLISRSKTIYCDCHGCEDCDECDEKELNLDLHSNNFLYRRDGTIVLNDPLSDSDMEDVDDLSNWADEMEIVE